MSQDAPRNNEIHRKYSVVSCGTLWGQGRLGDMEGILGKDTWRGHSYHQRPLYWPADGVVSILWSPLSSICSSAFSWRVLFDEKIPENRKRVCGSRFPVPAS